MVMDPIRSLLNSSLQGRDHDYSANRIESWASTLTQPLRVVEELLGAAPPEVPDSNEIPAYYAQFPERMVWAKVVEGEAPEPLDGELPVDAAVWLATA